MRPAESVASSAVKTAFDTNAAMIGKKTPKWCNYIRM